MKTCLIIGDKTYRIYLSNSSITLPEDEEAVFPWYFAPPLEELTYEISADGTYATCTGLVLLNLLAKLYD